MLYAPIMKWMMVRLILFGRARGGDFMKIHGKILGVLCCLVFLGTFSFDALSAQAAVCNHETCFEFFDYKTYYYEEDGHYGDLGVNYVCTNCGYQYWDDSTLRYVRICGHDYQCYKLVESSDDRDVYIADCEDPECPYQNVRIYNKK